MRTSALRGTIAKWPAPSSTPAHSSSAIVKLYHAEIGSDRMERLAKTPGARLIVSQLSLIEIESVLAIKVRTGVISKIDLARFHEGDRKPSRRL